MRFKQSVMSSIDPNRVFYFSGSAGIPNGPQSPDEGGPIMQDTDRKPGKLPMSPVSIPVSRAEHTQGCAHTTPNLDCWPLKWHPIMKHLQDAGITWQIYQESPNQHGAAEILSGFEDFNLTRPGDPLYDRGLTKNADDTLVTFIYQAVNGTLPQVSWIISDEVLSERPGYRPQDGVYRQLAVVASTATGQSRNNTALFISYDGKGPLFNEKEILTKVKMQVGGSTMFPLPTRSMEQLENGCKTHTDNLAIHQQDLVSSLFGLVLSN